MRNFRAEHFGDSFGSKAIAAVNFYRWAAAKFNAKRLR
ncbi:hypothetical protein CAMGR0001_0239 [Campylobacter gracilis RM3268]|uniref:Uncharacterized protein n=1 Tax=Campylobacter gracilis RM3268 TaxID=553220 RepID=C8PKL7_9BACT|nr:hypothetical protein CAMGR0001_0239 [Campylobacter gracilis RM3268]